jgi:hypothetical protein
VAADAGRDPELSGTGQGRNPALAERRRLCVAILAMAALATACSYRPRVHLEGDGDGIDDWRLGLPF